MNYCKVKWRGWNTWSEAFVPELEFCVSGFLNKEIEKANIDVADSGESPEAPHPREMIDLEVGLHV